MKNNKPHINIFIAYAREDENILEALRKQLSVLENRKLVKIWYDGKIQAGENWDDEIKQKLDEAEIILLLISADFMYSEYARGIEMEKALEKHEAGTARVLPVIVRDCLWEEEKIATIQVLPKDGIPVDSEKWKNWDTPLKQVVKAVSDTAQEIKATKIVNQEWTETDSVKKQVLYAAFVKKANEHYSKKQWQKAVEKYGQALQYAQIDSDPPKSFLQNRIQQSNIEMGFAEKMRLGKAALKAKEWSAAQRAFKEALRLKPEHSELQNLQQQTQAQIARQQQSEKALAFNALIAETQSLLQQKEWASAKTKNQQAYNLWQEGWMPNRTEIQQQNEYIETEIALAEELYLAAQYEAQGADKTALKHYEAALNLKNTPQIREQKIACENRIKEARNKAITNIAQPVKQYGRRIGAVLLLLLVIWGISKMIPPPTNNDVSSSDTSIGDTSNAENPLLGGAGGGLDSLQLVKFNDFFNAAQVLYNEKMYDKTLVKLDSALAYFPNDEKALQLQKNAQKAQNEQSEAEKQKAKETAYQNLIDKANSKFNNRQWTSAKSDYEAALAIKPNESHSKGQIKKIDAKLIEIAQAKTAQEEQARKDKEYNRLIQVADGEYNRKQWKEAKNHYEQAATYKNTAYVKERIGAIDWRFKQEAIPSNLDPEIQKLLQNMVTVQGGTFDMGCTKEQEGDCNETREKPVHKVTVSSFKMGIYEVTQAQWKAVMGSNPSSKSEDCGNCPVESVSWNDVQDFLKKLNAQTGKKFRLPTEAEWEFAARGGNESKGYKYAGSNNINEVAWYTKTTNDSGTKEVGTKKPNELGLYDMSGNVWEWCNDWYGAYSSDSQRNPKGALSGKYRLLRGGSWLDLTDYCRVSLRFSSLPSDGTDDFGLRLVEDF